ncbi:hypothetical protein ACFQVA_08485 [Actinomadura keratinilytica]
MSKRNSQAAKSAARERLRIEREKQAKKDKARRQLIVAGSVVGVLAIAGGVGFAVVKANEPGYWEKAADQKLVKRPTPRAPRAPPSSSARTTPPRR